MSPSYHEVYARWRDDPEGFWAEAAESVHWFRRWDAVLDRSRAPFYRWFPGAETNTCYNALDRHVEGGRADQVRLYVRLARGQHRVRTEQHEQDDAVDQTDVGLERQDE